MSKLKVKLIAHTPDPDKVVSMAAKLCYSPIGVEEMSEKITSEEVEKFLGMLISLGHESPVEHTSFTFAIEGISRACSHQIVRHRIASYSQQSQRYVRLSDFEYIIPPSIEADEKAKALYIRAMDRAQEDYNALVEALMNDGRTEKEAIEDARYVFPNACETKIVVTMNARSLLNFFALRTCNRAQWEIRRLGIEMLREVKKVYPTLFKNAGPGCVNGPCPEGAMTCGKIVEVREYFDDMNREAQR